MLSGDPLVMRQLSDAEKEIWGDRGELLRYLKEMKTILKEKNRNVRIPEDP